MKWILLLGLCLLCVSTTHAQNPDFYRDGKNMANNRFPFMDSNNHTQLMYAPSDFNIVPASGAITKIYMRTFYFEGSFAYGYYAEFHQLKISFKQTTDVQFNNNNFYTGLTTAYTTPAFLAITPAAVSNDGWVAFNLATPFNYDNTKTLVVDIQFQGRQGELRSWADSITNYKTLTSRAPNATQGTLSPLWNYFGMDISPTSVCSGVPIAGSVSWSKTGTCGANTYDLNLVGWSKTAGLTVQWQRATAPAGPYTNIGPASANALYSVINSSNYWYRAAVSCGASVSHTAPVLLTPNQYLPGGTYTINSALPTAGTNFRSFNTMAEALSCGIGGPVTVNVSPNSGNYYERASIPPVNNTSPINTISLNGNGNKMTYSLFHLVGPRAILQVNGTDYLTIDSLNFNIVPRAGEYDNYFVAGVMLQVKNDANNVTIKNCYFDSGAYRNYSSGYYWWGGGNLVVADTTVNYINSSYLQYYSTKCDSINIIGNVFRDAGLLAFGDTSNNEGRGYRITGNTFLSNRNRYWNTSNWGGSNLGMSFCRDALIRDNLFLGSGGYGTYYGDMNVSGNNILIEKNRFIDTVVFNYPYYNNNHGGGARLSGKGITFRNNLLYASDSSGGNSIILTYLDSSFILFNTLIEQDFLSYNYYYYRAPILYESGNGNVTICNNLFSINALPGTYKTCMLISSTASLSGLNSFNNNFHIPNGNPIRLGISISSMTLAAWQAYSGEDLTSDTLNPQFLSPATLNFRPTNLPLDNRGVPAAATVDDITGVVRNTITPDIGAFEFGVLTCPPVTNLTASGITPTSATLNWNTSGGFNNFLYVLDQNPGNPSVAGSAITGTTFIATPLQPYTTYYFHIRTDCIGLLANWVTVSFTTPCNTPLTNISPAGPITICYNSSATLSVPGNSNASYQWLRNGVNIPGANTASYVATTAGSYTVQATMGTCSGQSTTPVIVTVNAQPLITAAGSTTICQGNTIVLNAGSASSYQWLRNGSAIAGATGAAYNAGLAGNYRVLIFNGSCQDSSNTIVVTVNQYPSNSVTPAGPVSFCDNQPLAMNAVVNSGYTYQWSNNGNPIPGAVSSSYTTTISGSFTVTIANGACTATSGPVAVTALTTPVAIADAVGNTIFCNNGSVFITSTPGSGYTYRWLRNNVLIPGATSVSYTASQEGTFTAIVSNGVCADTSLGLEVVFNAYPRPSIVQIGNYLHTVNAYPAYQWHKNGLPVAFANARDYTPITDGSYVVVVTDTSGCQGASNVITINSLAVNGLQGEDIVVYPNPATALVYVNYHQPVVASVHAMDGKLVMPEQEIIGQLDISALAEGVYMLRLKDRSGHLLTVKRITKIR